MTVHQYQPWQEKAAAYRAEVAARIPNDWMLPASIINSISADSHQVILDIPRTCGILTAEELDITENYDAVSMAQLLAEGKFTSVAVTTAFCKRAAIAQQLVRRPPRHSNFTLLRYAILLRSLLTK
jgi:amidase